MSVSRTVAAAALHVGRDCEERPQLRRHRRVLGIGDDGVDERALVTQMTRRDGGVTVMAEVAFVERRDVGGDELALASAEGVRGVEQDVGERGHRGRDLGTERKQGPDARDALGYGNMSHGSEL